MSKKTIWEYLKARGFSDVAAAAIMGNMEAESNCVSIRLQGDFSVDYQKSKDYTERVDSGIIGKRDFVYNGPGGGGYGLCQWTYWSRKDGLYDLAKFQGASIGDEAIQVEWLYQELHQDEYRSVLNTLLNTEDIRTCSDALLKKFFRPADQSDAVCVQRAKYGKDFYNEFAGGQSEDPDGQPDMIQITAEEYKNCMEAMNVLAYLKDAIKTLEEFQL
jgi:hypothetical protein